MILNDIEKNILIQSLTEQRKLKILFYEILNLYSVKSFMTKENISLFNSIIKTKTNNINNTNGIKINIETDPEKLISKLELNLISLNDNLHEINSLKNENKNNTNDNNNIDLKNKINKKYYIYDNIIDKYMQYLFSNNNFIFISNINSINNNVNNLFIFEENYFQKLIKKQSLIGKYFKKLKIKYSKNNKNNNKEFVQIKITIYNLFVVWVVFPFNLKKFLENDFHKNIKIIVNSKYDPTIKNVYDDNYNNYSNYKLYKKLTIIFNNIFKDILKNEISKNFQKISFLKVFTIFLDYIYNYDIIFKIKCKKCLNKLKFIGEENYFSIPCYKLLNLDDNYINNIYNNIEKGKDINNKNLYDFFHEECLIK